MAAGGRSPQERSPLDLGAREGGASRARVRARGPTSGITAVRAEPEPEAAARRVSRRSRLHEPGGAFERLRLRLDRPPDDEAEIDDRDLQDEHQEDELPHDASQSSAAMSQGQTLGQG